MLQILLQKNPESNIFNGESHRAINQKALWVLWPKARERKETVEQQNKKCQKCNRTGVSCATVALWITYSCEKTFVNFLTVGRHEGVSYTTGAETKQVPGLTQQSLVYCKCRWEVKKTLRTGWQGENPCWVNKSSLWGTVFPGALCEVWLQTQTSFHYVATAMELPELGDRPCHLQPWAAGRCRGFSFS